MQKKQRHMLILVYPTMHLCLSGVLVGVALVILAILLYCFCCRSANSPHKQEKKYAGVQRVDGTTVDYNYANGDYYVQGKDNNAYKVIIVKLIILMID